MMFSSVAALCVVGLMAAFAATAAVRSILSGRLAMVPADVSRKTNPAGWGAGVLVQVLTAAGLLVICTKLFAEISGK